MNIAIPLLFTNLCAGLFRLGNRRVTKERILSAGADMLAASEKQADAARMGLGSRNGAKLTRNGKKRLPSLSDLDRRTAAYRDAMDLIDRVIAERGGRDQVDIVRAASAETWAVLTTLLRAMQVRWLNGGCVDWSEFAVLRQRVQRFARS
jgi:hypothetical protein